MSKKSVKKSKRSKKKTLKLIKTKFPIILGILLITIIFFSILKLTNIIQIPSGKPKTPELSMAKCPNYDWTPIEVAFKNVSGEISTEEAAACVRLISDSISSQKDLESFTGYTSEVVGCGECGCKPNEMCYHHLWDNAYVCEVSSRCETAGGTDIDELSTTPSQSQSPYPSLDSGQAQPAAPAQQSSPPQVPDADGCVWSEWAMGAWCGGDHEECGPNEVTAGRFKVRAGSEVQSWIEFTDPDSGVTVRLPVYPKSSTTGCDATKDHTCKPAIYGCKRRDGTSVPNPSPLPSDLPDGYSNWVSTNTCGEGECADHQILKARYRGSRLEGICVDEPDICGPAPSDYSETDDVVTEPNHPAAECLPPKTAEVHVDECGEHGCLSTQRRACRWYYWSDTGELCKKQCVCVDYADCEATFSNNTDKVNPPDGDFPNMPSGERCVRGGEYFNSCVQMSDGSKQCRQVKCLGNVSGFDGDTWCCHECWNNEDCQDCTSIWDISGVGGAYCGDDICNGYETYLNCSIDCQQGEGSCGNGQCDNLETPITCPEDCPGKCGDFICQYGENYDNCPLDCGQNSNQCSRYNDVVSDDFWETAYNSGTGGDAGTYRELGNSTDNVRYFNCHATTTNICIQEGGEWMGDSHCCCLIENTWKSAGECGDGICNRAENSQSCPQDCRSSAGDPYAGCTAWSNDPRFSGCHCDYNLSFCPGTYPYKDCTEEGINDPCIYGEEYDDYSGHGACCCDTVNRCHLVYDDEEGACLTVSECEGQGGRWNRTAGYYGCGAGLVCCQLNPWHDIQSHHVLETCGNGICDQGSQQGENCKNCAQDCLCPPGSSCEVDSTGNAYCEGAGGQGFINSNASGGSVNYNTGPDIDYGQEQGSGTGSEAGSPTDFQGQPVDTNQPADDFTRNMANGDANNDGSVNDADLGIWWTSYKVDDSGDFNGDGETNELDFAILWQNWDL